MFPSYRNESTDLLCKSADWFLYEGNTAQLTYLFLLFIYYNKSLDCNLQKQPLKMFWRCSESLWHRCFPANFTKFLRTPFYRTLLDDCFWIYWYGSVYCIYFHWLKYSPTTSHKFCLIKKFYWSSVFSHVLFIVFFSFLSIMKKRSFLDVL